MNKSRYGRNIFSTICVRNVSLSFVATSCECEELTLHGPCMTFHGISVIVSSGVVKLGGGSQGQ